MEPPCVVEVTAFRHHLDSRWACGASVIEMSLWGGAAQPRPAVEEALRSRHMQAYSHVAYAHMFPEMPAVAGWTAWPGGRLAWLAGLAPGWHGLAGWPGMAAGWPACLADLADLAGRPGWLTWLAGLAGRPGWLAGLAGGPGCLAGLAGRPG